LATFIEEDMLPLLLRVAEECLNLPHGVAEVIMTFSHDHLGLAEVPAHRRHNTKSLQRCEDDGYGKVIFGRIVL
jgi:hypothetical protein